MTDPVSNPASSTPLLFTPATYRGVTARNRIVVSPMCQYESVDGGPTDWHLVQMGKFAIGGAGIVFHEETAVEARGRKTHHCAGLYKDSHVPAYRRINAFIRRYGAVPAVQLGHSGRKSSNRGPLDGRSPLGPEDAARGEPPWQGYAPSPIPMEPGYHTPHAMTLDEIRQSIETWRIATLRSAEADFDIIEIHGAHGYLIHEFLSPGSNTRSDAYGGDLAGRMRYGLEIAEVVRAHWPSDKPLFWRLSAVDSKGGYWDIEDSLALAHALKARGIDVIDCSSGGVYGDSALPAVPRVAGYQVPYADIIRREAGIPTMAVGGITEAHQAEDILQQGQADLIAMARELMWESNWPAHAAQKLGVEDFLGLFPRSYGDRLRGRERERRDYPPGTNAEIPMRLSDYQAAD
jgi:2,4-dienoyl-CoA reductase-like NADH-dependent reductase (Old Yellow Enzyme family)